MSYRITKDESRAHLSRDHLTIWSGPFADSFAGWATSLPGGDGYMITPRYPHLGKVRVSCPTPRDDDTFQQVDAAINAALAAAWDDT